MNLLIPIEQNKGINSKLSMHFGHCPYFAIYKTKSKKLKIIKNQLEHSDKNLTPVDQIMKFKPDIVFTKGIGQRAINLFNEKKVQIKTGNYNNVEEVIKNINNLNKLNSGCNN